MAPRTRCTGAWIGRDDSTHSITLTPLVKWNNKPVGSSLHDKHLDMLTRLSQSGYSWAREALAPGAMLLYVAVNGFAPGFLPHAEGAGVRVITWSLEDLYPPHK
jgi:hypothetical protein